MKKSSILIIGTLLLVTVAVFGWDRNKEERASLLNQITDLEANLSHLNEQNSGVSSAIEALSSEVDQYADSLRQHTQRRTKLQDELGAYVLEHKMATLALIAAGGGVASIINDNMGEDTKEVLRALGAIGAVYCIFNSEECADVTAHILYFGAQIESAGKSISDMTSKLSAKKTALKERENEQDSLKGVISKKTLERDALKQKHDSLVCRFCFY